MKNVIEVMQNVIQLTRKQLVEDGEMKVWNVTLNYLQLGRQNYFILRFPPDFFTDIKIYRVHSEVLQTLELDLSPVNATLMPSSPYYKFNIFPRKVGSETIAVYVKANGKVDVLYRVDLKCIASPNGIFIDADSKDLKVYEQITNGAEGNIYRACYLSHRTVVKEYKTEEYSKEAELLQQLHHPNIITLWAMFYKNTHLNLVIEEASFSLDKVYADIPNCTLFTILRDVASALSFIHSQQIVHRDVKPQNILVMSLDKEKCSAKLADFGLAWVIGNHKINCKCEGTPFFMAPELLLENGVVSTRADTYSFGRTIQLAYSRISLEQAVTSLPKTLCFGVVKDDFVKTFVMKCCEDTPTDRLTDDEVYNRCEICIKRSKNEELLIKRANYKYDFGAINTIESLKMIIKSLQSDGLNDLAFEILVGTSDGKDVRKKVEKLKASVKCKIPPRSGQEEYLIGEYYRSIEDYKTAHIYYMKGGKKGDAYCKFRIYEELKKLCSDLETKTSAEDLELKTVLSFFAFQLPVVGQIFSKCSTPKSFNVQTSVSAKMMFEMIYLFCGISSAVDAEIGKWEICGKGTQSNFINGLILLKNNQVEYEKYSSLYSLLTTPTQPSKSVDEFSSVEEQNIYCINVLSHFYKDVADSEERRVVQFMRTGTSLQQLNLSLYQLSKERSSLYAVKKIIELALMGCGASCVALYEVLNTPEMVQAYAAAIDDVMSVNDLLDVFESPSKPAEMPSERVIGKTPSNFVKRPKHSVPLKSLLFSHKVYWLLRGATLLQMEAIESLAEVVLELVSTSRTRQGQVALCNCLGLIKFSSELGRKKSQMLEARCLCKMGRNKEGWEIMRRLVEENYEDVFIDFFNEMKKEQNYEEMELVAKKANQSGNSSETFQLNEVETKARNVYLLIKTYAATLDQQIKTFAQNSETHKNENQSCLKELHDRKRIFMEMMSEDKMTDKISKALGFAQTMLSLKVYERKDIEVTIHVLRYLSFLGSKNANSIVMRILGGNVMSPMESEICKVFEKECKTKPTQQWCNAPIPKSKSADTNVI
ncbi:serine-threonine protein kinase, putative [Entamoeba invadens IP1]|uniref:Serine-threonine protein kinase, putative n=1 Tax=Entamoeba invadens IP1 TaxID=370355 RepID=A0A0A1UF80_ENTIV|nr:serine-threonine protein kinase, putative [Entamoeba invadens IP1]ELP95266.1 serine-threonine protein kinase, putative [Entamoeba invadens IP1]|eukprot:XP_004262037.1 serine-threonine protein kinase, putative [Entamoeba invadens IP1]